MRKKEDMEDLQELLGMELSTMKCEACAML
jgi:hypothetical protein